MEEHIACEAAGRHRGTSGILPVLESDAKERIKGDRCVCCGDEVPEGRMVCMACEKGMNGNLLAELLAEQNHL